MSRPRILVINPNSNQLVTQGLEQALKPLDFEGGPEIICETLTEGPYGIESQADVDGVTMPLRRLVEGDNHSAAFVIARATVAHGPRTALQFSDYPIDLSQDIRVGHRAREFPQTGRLSA
jgi:hypothetical protein